MGKTDRILHRHAFQPRGNEGTVEGITGSDGIHRLHAEAGNTLSLDLLAEPYAAPAQRNQYGIDAFGVQRLGCPRRVVVVIDGDTREDFHFGFIRRNDVDQRQQLIRELGRRCRIEDHLGVAGARDASCGQHAVQR